MMDRRKNILFYLVGIFVLVVVLMPGSISADGKIISFPTLVSILKTRNMTRPILSPGTHQQIKGLTIIPPPPPPPIQAAAPTAVPVADPVAVTVAAPVTDPAAAPIADLAAAPIADPVAVTVAAPVTDPAAVTVAAPVAEPVVATVADPAPAPVPVAVVAPVATPVSTPVAAPVSTPVAAPVSAPVPTPVAVPVAAPPISKHNNICSPASQERTNVQIARLCSKSGHRKQESEKGEGKPVSKCLERCCITVIPEPDSDDTIESIFADDIVVYTDCEAVEYLFKIVKKSKVTPKCYDCSS